MRGLIIAAGLFALGPNASAAPDQSQIATQDQPVTRESATAALREAAIRAQNGDTRGVISLLQPVVTSQAFHGLAEPQRFAGVYLLGAALYDIGQHAAAHPLLRQATEFPQATGHTWNLRFWSALNARDYVDATEALDRLARRWPAVVREYPEETVTFLIRHVRDLSDADAREYQVLMALRTVGWRSSNVFVEPSYRWRTLARLLHDRGEIEQARAVARDVTAPSVLVGMLVDRRFDAVLEGQSRQIDFAAAFERELEARRALSAAHPDSLEGVMDVVFRLITLNRATEALPIVDEAIARAESPMAEGRRFEDQAEWANWMYDYRSRALVLLGRGDEALEAMRRGSRRVESGGENVSQTINLAELLLRLGRPAEALAALSDLQEQYLSPYGWMNANYVRACANAELGESAGAREILRQMRGRADDSRRVLIETELCLGDIDAAARLFREALDDPRDRLVALLDAQNLLRPETRSGFEQRMDERYASMIARPEVQRAIERHGRVLTIPILRSGL